MTNFTTKIMKTLINKGDLDDFVFVNSKLALRMSKQASKRAPF